MMFDDFPAHFIKVAIRRTFSQATSFDFPAGGFQIKFFQSGNAHFLILEVKFNVLDKLNVIIRK